MSKDLSLYTNFNKIGSDYKSARNDFLKNEKKAQEYIDNETKNEKKERFKKGELGLDIYEMRERLKNKGLKYE